MVCSVLNKYSIIMNVFQVNAAQKGFLRRILGEVGKRPPLWVSLFRSMKIVIVIMQTISDTNI